MKHSMDKIAAWWNGHPEELAKYLKESKGRTALKNACDYVGIASMALLAEKLEKEFMPEKWKSE